MSEYEPKGPHGQNEPESKERVYHLRAEIKACPSQPGHTAGPPRPKHLQLVLEEPVNPCHNSQTTESFRKFLREESVLHTPASLLSVTPVSSDPLIAGLLAVTHLMQVCTVA